MLDPDLARKHMVEEQIKKRGIEDEKVLEAFISVKRHLFVPGPFDEAAYSDRPLPIGRGQTISQPYMVALMTECLRLEGTERVLEVGTGSGYQAAILASIAKEVYTVERDEKLLEGAKKILLKEGFTNIEFDARDGTKGWEEKAPFDGIIVTAASPGIPESLKEQLAEGGRLVIPVGSRYSQMLITVTKKGRDFETEDVCGCIFVPLVGEEGWRE